MRPLLARFRAAFETAPEPPRGAAVGWLCLLSAYFLYRAVVREPLEIWERGVFVLCAAMLPSPGWLRRLGAGIALIWFYLTDRLLHAPFSAANHEWLEAFLLALLAVSPSGYGGLRRIFMAAAVILIGWTGVQKLANGYYLRGDFFTVSIAQPSQKFAAPVLPRLSESRRAEYTAFHRAYRAHIDAAVPGVLDLPLPRDPAVVWLSRAACWATLLAELAGPVLLIPRRTRRVTAALLVVFFLGVEAVAHEWVFGALTALFLILFLAPRPGAPPGEVGARPREAAFAACSAALLGLLTVWPAVQMALVRRTGLSPWKLAGFGMYSVPARFGGVVVETRGPGETEWALRPPRDLREERFYSSRSYVLRHAPFLRPAAGDLAELAFREPEGLRPAEVRVRSLSMLYDRETGRFQLVERAFLFP